MLHARHELHELERYDLQVDVAQSHDDHVALQLAPSPLPQLLGRQDFVDFCGVPEADQAPGPAATEAPASQESAPEPAAGAGRATKTSLSAEVCSRETLLRLAGAVWLQCCIGLMLCLSAGPQLDRCLTFQQAGAGWAACPLIFGTWADKECRCLLIVWPCCRGHLSHRA